MVYKLLKKFVPEISGKEIIKDYKFGGIKLVYQLTDENNIHQIMYFIKPYKEHLASSKAMVPKGKWGNTTSPLSNVWYQTHLDYKNVNEIDPETPTKKSLDFMLSLVEVGAELIPHLNRIEDLFSIGEEIKQPQSILTKIKNVFKF